MRGRCHQRPVCVCGIHHNISCSGVLRMDNKQCKMTTSASVGMVGGRIQECYDSSRLISYIAMATMPTTFRLVPQGMRNG